MRFVLKLLVLIFICGCLASGIFLNVHDAYADGMVVAPDPYSDRWDYIAETEQLALIKYENGRQTLILSIEYDPGSAAGAVWIFPVPSDPAEVDLDILAGIPNIKGEEIGGAAQSVLDDYRWIAMYPNIYAFPFIYFIVGDTVITATSSFESSLGEESGSSQDVIVHEEFIKEGITSQVLTAQTSEGLYEYLISKGLKITDGEIDVLDQYIGSDYSFITSWLTPTAGTAAKSTKGVQVTFPTESLYYPLIPTSVYGDEIVPAEIRVLGHVTPDVYENIKNNTTTEYYIKQDYKKTNIFFGISWPDDYGEQSRINKDFIGSWTGDDLLYTKIAINAPSNALTDDLWIQQKVPFSTRPIRFIISYPAITVLTIVIISSVLLAIIFGLIFFKSLRRNIGALILIGLSNVFTIIGLAICLCFVHTKSNNPQADKIIEYFHRKKYYIKRRIALVMLLISTPFVFFSGIFSLWLWLTSIVVFIAGMILKRVDKKDKIYLKELSKFGHSVWTLIPADSNKIKFGVLFSIGYFFIVVLLIYVLKALVAI